jgi:hypothetical protein
MHTHHHHPVLVTISGLNIDQDSVGRLKAPLNYVDGKVADWQRRPKQDIYLIEPGVAEHGAQHCNIRKTFLHVFIRRWAATTVPGSSERVLTRFTHGLASTNG